jgi:hypothetical protein
MMVIVAVSAITKQTPIEDINLQLITEGFGERRIANYLMSPFIVAITISMYFQMVKLVGKNRRLNYLKGNYRKPKKEIRNYRIIENVSFTPPSCQWRCQANKYLNKQMTGPLITFAPSYSYDSVVWCKYDFTSIPITKNIKNNPMTALRIFI